MNIDEINKEKVELLKQLKELEIKEEEIKQQELEQQKQENIKTFEFIEKNKDVILPLLEHRSINCNDNCPNSCCNKDYIVCNKCFLIELLNGEWSPENYKIDFNIDIERIN